MHTTVFLIFGGIQLILCCRIARVKDYYGLKLNILFLLILSLIYLLTLNSPFIGCVAISVFFYFFILIPLALGAIINGNIIKSDFKKAIKNYGILKLIAPWYVPKGAVLYCQALETYKAGDLQQAEVYFNQLPQAKNMWQLGQLSLALFNCDYTKAEALTAEFTDNNDFLVLLMKKIIIAIEKNDEKQVAELLTTFTFVPTSVTCSAWSMVAAYTGDTKLWNRLETMTKKIFSEAKYLVVKASYDYTVNQDADAYFNALASINCDNDLMTKNWIEYRQNNHQWLDVNSRQAIMLNPMQVVPQSYSSIRRAVLPDWSKHKPVVTWVLAVLCVEVFIAQQCCGLTTFKDWVNFGALLPLAVLPAHEWWRVFTHQVLHHDLSHLLSNLFGLLIFSRFESILGWRWMIIFILSVSLMGSGINLLTDMILFQIDYPYTMVGLSGVVYGILGGFWAYTVIATYVNKNPDSKGMIALLSWYTIFGLGQDLTTYQEGFSVVNGLAHLAGALSGAVIYVLIDCIKHRSGNIVAYFAKKASLCWLSGLAALAIILAGHMQLRGTEPSVSVVNIISRLEELGRPQAVMPWLVKHANAGNTVAMDHLAIKYRDAKQPEDALHWAERSARQGDGWAQGLTSYFYETGEGTKPSPQKALHWLKNAVEAKDAYSTVHLGQWYLMGYQVPKDTPKGLALITPLATSGNAYAQGILGAELYTGKDLPKDITQALKWTQKAADQNDALAQNNLADMYETGQGVPQNYQYAFSWYTKAADQGFGSSSCSLALFYLKGLGVDADKAKALDWYTKARQQLGADKDQCSGKVHAELKLLEK
jgi:TPR repeat protein/membrane associated rhomboid family serine protease